MRQSASHAALRSGFLARVACPPRPGASVRRHGTPRRGRARGATRRAAATLRTAYRRSCPRPARTRASACRTVTFGVRRQRPETRARDDRGVSRPGAAASDRIHRRAGPSHGQSQSRKNGRVAAENPSEAELAVLRCLATGLSRREIGAQLYISLNTVKTHNRELYRKLGATSRAEAVARGEALGLLDHTESPGDPEPNPPRVRQPSVMLRLECQRTATASSSRGSSGLVTRPLSTE